MPRGAAQSTARSGLPAGGTGGAEGGEPFGMGNLYRLRQKPSTVKGAASQSALFHGFSIPFPIPIIRAFEYSVNVKRRQASAGPPVSFCQSWRTSHRLRYRQNRPLARRFFYLTAGRLRISRMAAPVRRRSPATHGRAPCPPSPVEGLASSVSATAYRLKWSVSKIR